MSKTKRTKEQLIHAQQCAEQQDVDDILGAMLGATVVDLAADCAMGSLDALARAAGLYWQRVTFLGFGLRRVDEQGRMLAVGEIETRPHEPGREREVLAWTSGEHLDDVLTYGAEQVTARARQALAAWGRQKADQHQQLLHKAEVVLRDLGAKPIGAGAPPARFDVHAALAAGTYDETRKVLRSMGLDLMPLLRWEDVRAWLLSIGCKVEEHEHVESIRISKGDHMKDGWMLCTHPSNVEHVLADLGKMLDMPVRAVREAILQHVEQPRDLTAPRRCPIPETKEQFLAALGVEPGVAYPGLREKIAEWCGLPLTEEQSKAEAASRRAFETGMCDACRAKQEAARQIDCRLP